MKRKPISRKPKKRKSPALRALRQTKTLGRSAVSKGPARDPEHLARVREHPCLIQHYEPSLATCYGAVQAHHCRHIRQRTMGKRVSDYFTVPLCVRHHILLHEGDEDAFWDGFFINPRFFIRTFSKEGAAELERIEQRIGSGVVER